MRYLTTLMLLVAPVSGVGQLPASVGPGTRVRVTSPFVRRQVATVASVSTESMAIVPEQPPRDTLAILLVELQRLEVSQGWKRDTWRGVGVGAVAGGITGAVIGAVTYRRPECDEGAFGCSVADFGPGGQAAIAGALGAIAGAVVGGVIGSLHTSEHWRGVKLQLSVGPAAGRRVGVALAGSTCR
ncbi:MAG TPA: hypothetical protein VF041_21335 [Gemmatimonadaceae bacterium]